MHGLRLHKSDRRPNTWATPDFSLSPMSIHANVEFQKHVLVIRCQQLYARYVRYIFENDASSSRFSAKRRVHVGRLFDSANRSSHNAPGWPMVSFPKRWTATIPIWLEPNFEKHVQARLESNKNIQELKHRTTQFYQMCVCNIQLWLNTMKARLDPPIFIQMCVSTSFIEAHRWFPLYHHGCGGTLCRTSGHPQRPGSLPWFTLLSHINILNKPEGINDENINHLLGLLYICEGFRIQRRAWTWSANTA